MSMHVVGDAEELDRRRDVGGDAGRAAGAGCRAVGDPDAAVVGVVVGRAAVVAEEQLDVRRARP